MIVTIFKLNILHLILCLTFVELNTKSIISYQNDKTKYVDKMTTTSLAGIEIYNLINSQYDDGITTDVPLENSIMPAELMENTTPSMGTNNNNDIKQTFNEVFTTTTSDLNFNDLDNLFFKFENDDDNTCFLDNVKSAFLWWTFPNGTLKEFNLINTITHLDLSFRNISQDEELYRELQNVSGDNNTIVCFSAAYNNLTAAPQQTLQYIGNSLKYLTLAGNNFATVEMAKEYNNYNNNRCNSNNPDYLGNPNEGDNKSFLKNNVAWASFPNLPNLRELDISNCNIEYVTKMVFRNMTNLKRLYMSHNQILNIPLNTFVHITSLEYFDLSFNNVFDDDELLSQTSMDNVFNYVYGLNIQPLTFKFLPNLIYLDLSHTKLKRSSILAFTNLGNPLKYASLCYTAFPFLDNDLFKNTSLEGLDLSGNNLAAYYIINDAFEGVSDTLKYLYFEKSNLKDISWLQYLHNLHLLGLAGNNINSLTMDVFSPLTKLQLVDLSSNQVGNWYSQVFLYNANLRVLSLRDNNLNIITSEMTKDFSKLDYLSLGDNNFICDCMLRDILDVAAVHNTNENCTRNVLENLQDDIKENLTTFEDRVRKVIKSKLITLKGQINITKILWDQHFHKLKFGTWKNKKFKNSQKKVIMRFLANNPKQCTTTETSTVVTSSDKFNGTTLNFQLLDYEEEHYWCFNETEKMQFMQLNCIQRSYASDIAEQLDTLTTYVIVCVSTLLGIAILGVLIYWKRWYIHYFYSSLKTASLLSSAAKENNKQFNHLCDNDPNMIYDIFISYCQNDRDWILEELMPNVEETGDISICLHERDFQIGVTIIDNIVSCMERSRALMLIISSSFLLSHWCQFEMQLAQHRLFDVGTDQMILVFLEDIPRSKRPKHLQYLMDIKTYIKWPGGKDRKVPRLEERKLFWKRLKRSLTNIGLNPTESKA